jgi:hypothetical protein
MVKDILRNTLQIKFLKYPNYGGENGLNSLNLDIFAYVTEEREFDL